MRSEAHLKYQDQTHFKDCAEKKPWKKNLYENIGYPDNYTDKSFLNELKKNVHVKEISFTEALSEVVKITEKLCVSILFSMVFAYLHEGWVNPQTVFMLTSVVVFLCYSYYAKMQSSLSYRSIVSRNIKSVGILLMLGYIFSPVLRTLTDTISTDTIYATSTVMMLVHVGFYDYSHPVSIVSSSLSLNAAIFSSVCLASRLQTSFHAFVLLTISVELFVLYPHFRSAVMPLNLTFSCLLTFITFLSLSSMSLVMSVSFLFLFVFLNVICPLLFVHWQKYKDNIYGPWDEAVIDDNLDKYIERWY